ncbi:MAG: YggT family protein [Magnetococcales bacterium]|nr:YggT family protein [Magnetococcales bacterium]
MGITGSIASLLNLFLEIYSWMILGRVMLSWVNPDPYNPIVQFLIRATEPVLAPFRRLIPAMAGMDLSPIAALLAVHLTQRVLQTTLQSGMGAGALVGVLAELLGLIHLLMTFYLLLLAARGGFHFHSWRTFRQGRPPGIDLHKPWIRFIFQATEPAIRPLRRWVPTVSGMDVTPMAAVVVLLMLLSVIQEVMLGIAGTHLMMGR